VYDPAEAGFVAVKTTVTVWWVVISWLEELAEKLIVDEDIDPVHVCAPDAVTLVNETAL
jgi:hypothetical protein